jgi:GTP cyclohydrolase I
MKAKGTSMAEFNYNELDYERAEAAIREFLIAIGEDPEREGLLDTPSRVARACAEIFSGMHEDPSKHLLRQFHEADHEEMVIVRDIPFTSMCEHHLLPFTGKAHVAYIPRKGRITGLSKLARCVEGFARRPQVQERMTSQVADAIMEALEPLGVIVVVEAEHMCMTARGIRKPGSLTVTSAVRGSFQEDEKTRAEALSLFES